MLTQPIDDAPEKTRAGYRVVVPVIQRDYAQGREGKEELRELFLRDIHRALAGTGEGTPLVLDFVYGNREFKNGSWVFYPLDGQQRLTTLWLVHWYLAYTSIDKVASAQWADVARMQSELQALQQARAEHGEEDESAEEIILKTEMQARRGELKALREAASLPLERFSYETRFSSRVFCEKLCRMIGEPHPRPSGMNVVGFIRSRTWFFAAYQQDPTISGMLRTLGDIDAKFSGCDSASCWKRLTQGDASGSPCIVFHMTLVGEKQRLPLTDDLYIKMNARGKPLTDFENFKADFLDFIRKEKLETDASDGSSSTLAHHMDTIWTDLFWMYRSKENHIDEIWMVFIKRFFRCWYLAHGGSTSRNLHGKTIPDDTYTKLDDETGRYLSFDVYRLACSQGPEVCVKNLYQCLDGLHSFCRDETNKSLQDNLTGAFVPYWDADGGANGTGEKMFSFIPKYETGKNTVLNLEPKYRHLAVFYGICLYFAYGEPADRNARQDWMRFVWNMVENAQGIQKKGGSPVFLEEQLIVLVRLFGNIAADTWGTGQSGVRNIEKYLGGGSSPFREISCAWSTAWSQLKKIAGSTQPPFLRQFHEEIMKARQKSQSSISMKSIIEEAEKAAFFKGDIAFLFLDGQGEFRLALDGAPDADSNAALFYSKWKNAQRLFSKDGVCPDNTVMQQQVLKHFYSWCPDPLLNNDYSMVLNTWPSTWKYNVLNRYEYAEAVHHLLTDDDLKQWNTAPGPLASCLMHPEMLRTILARSNEKFLWINHQPNTCYYMRNYHQSGSVGIYLDFRSRDMVLAALRAGAAPLVKVDAGIECGSFFLGAQLDFTYRGIRFRWHDSNYIYLIDEELNDKKLRQTADRLPPEPTDEEKKYYCFAFNPCKGCFHAKHCETGMSSGANHSKLGECSDPDRTRHAECPYLHRDTLLGWFISGMEKLRG